MKLPRPLRLLLISFVVPGEKNGGEIVLDRHLGRDPEIELRVAEPEPVPKGVVGRLRLTRLSTALNDLSEMRPFQANQADIALVREFRPDAIVTVGQHVEYRRAIGLARRTGLPLITFFHDLWPAMIKLSPLGRWASQRAFRTLAAESSLCLCVSENMFAELGHPASGRVLLPIPGPGVPASDSPFLMSPLKVGYSGNLYQHGPTIGMVADQVLDVPDISLTIRGPNPEWSGERLARLTKAGIFRPPLERDAYERWMASLDVHLCTLMFDAPQASFARTSFPSKFLEMLRFGRPVVLWGPDYAAGVQWAIKHDAALVITSPDPTEVVGALQWLANDRALYAKFQNAARRCAELASYEVLHSQFKSHLREILPDFSASTNPSR